MKKLTLEPTSAYKGYMNDRRKASLCIFLFLFGGLSFVIDALDPLTPDPTVELNSATSDPALELRAIGFVLAVFSVFGIRRSSEPRRTSRDPFARHTSHFILNI